MHFSSSSILYLLPLSFLPFVVHLISNLMRRRRPFPYVRLLKATRQQQKGWRRIQDLLLAIFRSLALFFLILSASGPYIPRGPFPRRIVVDVSASMGPYRGRVSEFLSAFEGVERVFISAFQSRSMPENLLYPMDTSLLSRYRDSLTLLVSDFQRVSIPDTSLFMKYQVGPVENESAILSVEVGEDSIVVHMRGGDYLEVRQGDSMVAVFKASPYVSIGGDYDGFLRFYLMPMDEHPFDNVFYAYRGNRGRVPVRVVGRGLEERLLAGLALGIFGDTSSGGHLVVASGDPAGVREALSSGKKVIFFGVLPEIPHRVEHNILFQGVLIDSAVVFDNNLPYLVTEEVLFVGIPLKRLVLEPRLMEWFYPLALGFSGSTVVVYAHAGETVRFPTRITLLSPDGEVLRGRSITILDTGYYVSPDSSIVVCSNIDRSESDTAFFRIENPSFGKVDLSWLFLMISLAFLLLELFIVRKPH